MVFNYEENNYIDLIKRQSFVNIITDTYNNILFLPTGSTVAVQHKDGKNPGHMEN